MLLYVIFAIIGGVLVSLSRQINGRLSLSTSPMQSSFWNHIVGFLALTAVALVFGGLFHEGKLPSPPTIAFIGGPLGVIFVAASSWLVARIGAAQTAILVIAGQMVSGVLLDVVRDAPGSPLARTAGVALILLGMWLSQDRRKKQSN